MSNFVYLRVSGDKQDVKNQKYGVMEYATNHNLTGLQFIEDSVTSKKPWRERALGGMLANAEPGDTILVSEVSRLARSTLQVLEILQYCTEGQINLRIAKNNMLFDNSLQSKITATVLGMAAEIEREFISSRTKEALAARKAAGVKLGRPQGKAEKLKLDEKRDEIQKYINMGVSKAAIAKIIECPATTLYDYCKVRKIKAKEKKKA